MPAICCAAARGGKYYIIQSNYLASRGELFCSVTDSETKAILLLFYYSRPGDCGLALQQPAQKRNRVRAAFIQMLGSLSPLENQPAAGLLNIFQHQLSLCACVRAPMSKPRCTAIFITLLYRSTHTRPTFYLLCLLCMSANILELRSLHGTGSDLSATAKSFPLPGESGWIFLLPKPSCFTSLREFQSTRASSFCVDVENIFLFSTLRDESYQGWRM